MTRTGAWIQRGAAGVLLAMLLPADQATLASQANPDSSDLYYLVFLRPNPARTNISKAEGDRIQAAHMANIHKMADDGVLVAAGPFEGPPDTITGLFVLKTSSLERAREIAALDPTVAEHRNTVDVHEWRAPKGIGDEYFRLHKEDPGMPDNMQSYPFCLLYRSTAALGTRDRGGEGRTHGEYIERLRAEKKLGAAGNVNEEELIGVLIFKALPAEEAEALVRMDPAIRSGALRFEMYRWWSADHVLPW